MLNRYRTDAGGDLTLGQMAVTDHLEMAGFVLQNGTLRDPLGDFGFDRLGQHLLGTPAENLGQRVPRRWDWHNQPI